MKSFEALLGLRLIESLMESPNWESSLWDAVYRGLQEEFSAEQCPEGEFPTEAAKGD